MNDDTHIKDIDFGNSSVLISNSLIRSGITKLGELKDIPYEELLKIPNLGYKSVYAILATIRKIETGKYSIPKKPERIFEFDNGGSIDLAAIEGISPESCLGDFIVYSLSNNYVFTNTREKKILEVKGDYQDREKLYDAWKAFKNGI